MHVPDLPGDEEPRLPKPDEFRVPRAAETPEQHEVIDRLKQIGLPLAVRAQDDHAFGRERHVQARKVAEIADGQTAEHVRAGR